MVPFGIVVGGAIGLGVLLLVIGAAAGGRSDLSGFPGRGPTALRNDSARDAAPDFSLSRVGAEETATAEALRGQVVVLHFWATWCPPCRAEFPEFARWAQEEAGHPGVRVFAVSLDDTPDKALIWSLKYAGGLGVWYDEKKLAGEMGVTVIPSTVLLDRQGRVAFFQEGAQDWSRSGVPGRVEDLLRE